MAFLFVESLLGENNSRFVQIWGKILELLRLSVGLISTLIVMKEAVLPYSCRIVFSSLMGFWSCIRCFLSSPLTIIITINLMVLLIFASSAFYGRRDAADNHHEEIILLRIHAHDLDLHDDDVHIAAHHESPPPWDVVQVTPPPPSRTTIPIRNNTTSTTLQSPNKALFLNQALPPQPHDHEIDKTRGNYSSQSTEEEKADLSPPPLEKWKDVFVENEEEEEEGTMEATWEAITGGGKQKKPKKKQLKKSETWDAPPPQPRRLDSEEVLPTSPKWKELRKAETFNDAVSVIRRGGLIRRDPSMSLEEFNHKVETFIKNFNHTIRLERQQSRQNFLATATFNQKRL